MTMVKSWCRMCRNDQMIDTNSTIHTCEHCGTNNEVKVEINVRLTAISEGIQVKNIEQLEEAGTLPTLTRGTVIYTLQHGRVQSYEYIKSTTDTVTGIRDGDTLNLYKSSVYLENPCPKLPVEPLIDRIFV